MKDAGTEKVPAFFIYTNRENIIICLLFAGITAGNERCPRCANKRRKTALVYGVLKTR